MVSDNSHHQSLDRRRFEEAAPQFSHLPFLWLAIIESNFNFNKVKAKKKDLLSIVIANDSISHQTRRNLSRHYLGIVGFTYRLQ